ncbi:hypothetical protein ABK905_14810 [Acerihabitans sp. KWT182]|uniref:Uncharacterized protein n=1 Tax=Acerihabitans sp. KWT182 TaxID=3157919 RepID=A0AAU7Q4R6_9GAMM
MSTLRSYIYAAFEDYLSQSVNNSANMRVTEQRFSELQPYVINRQTIPRTYSNPNHLMDLMIWPPNTFAILAGLLEKKGWVPSTDFG